MAGRPQSNKADIEALQRLVLSTSSVVDMHPIIAYVMKSCGTTSREVGEVLGIPRQLADELYKQVKEQLL
jgi:hypothetical protein